MKIKRLSFFIPFLFIVVVFLSLVFKKLPEWSQKNFNSNFLTAIEKGDVSQAQQAIEKGADKNIRLPGGMTSVMFASQKGDIDLMHMLIGQKADFQLQDPSGTTALYLAVQYGHTEVVKMLLNEGANPNTKTTSGHTALDVANSIRRIKMRSRNKVRPPTVATMDEIIGLLQRSGAKAGN